MCGECWHQSGPSCCPCRPRGTRTACVLQPINLCQQGGQQAQARVRPPALRVVCAAALCPAWCQRVSLVKEDDGWGSQARAPEAVAQHSLALAHIHAVQLCVCVGGGGRQPAAAGAERACVRHAGGDIRPQASGCATAAPPSLRLLQSARPSHFTCAQDRGMNVALLPVAAARASRVLLQPGGPCSSTPRGGCKPRRLKASVEPRAANKGAAWRWRSEGRAMPQQATQQQHTPSHLHAARATPQLAAGGA